MLQFDVRPAYVQLNNIYTRATLVIMIITVCTGLRLSM